MGRTVVVPEDFAREEEVVEKEEEGINDVFCELLRQSGGCVATDGGFATQLEHHGADINDPLWSALCLITMPELIRKVVFVSPLFVVGFYWFFVLETGSDFLDVDWLLMKMASDKIG